MITPEYPPDRGGVADYTANLVQALCSHGLHMYTIVVGGHVTGTTTAVQGGCVERYPRRPGTWLHLLAALRERSGAIVHVQYVPHGYARHGVAPALILFAAAVRLMTGARLVITLHELWIPLTWHPVRLLLGLLQRAQVFMVAALSDVAITTTALNRRRLTLLQWATRLPLRQVPVGSNVPLSGHPSARAESILRHVPPSSAILAVFSPLTVGKAFVPLLDVLGAVPGTTLLCIGGLGDAERARAASMRDEIARRGLTPRVIWTGYIPLADVSALIQKSALYMHLQEGGASFRSTALAAAMEHRLPIIAYQGRETEPAFADGRNIRLVAPDNPRVLVSVVRQVLIDQALHRRLADSAYVLWQQQCSWDRVSEATIACYKQSDTRVAWRVS